MTAERAPTPSVALSIEDSARLVGAYVWVERRLFEVLGGFAGTETLPAAALFFDVRAQHHAWHAVLLAEQLPEVPGLDHDALTVPPASGAAQALGSLAAAPEAVGRLAGLVRVVLPRLVAGYRTHLALVAPVADAPLERALRLVVHDEVDALLEGEALLERLGAADPGALGAATDGLGSLESGLAPSGPGLVPWPGRPD